MAQITGTANGETLSGTATYDYIQGLGGNDTIYGQGGGDELSGGAGSDTIYGGAGTDTIYGGTENDFLYGQGENDIIYGGAGADRLYAGDGDYDYLSGQDGNDILYSGPSNKADMIGGSGLDTFNFQTVYSVGVYTISDFDPSIGEVIQLPLGTTLYQQTAAYWELNYTSGPLVRIEFSNNVGLQASANIQYV